MTTKTQNKQWYRISPEVEYSTDFKFFVENQIFVSKSGKQHSFCSRLESKTFKVKNSVLKSGSIPEIELENEIRIIHSEILAGKHGQGNLVN